MSILKDSSVDVFQLLRETFSYFCFCFVFQCDNWSKYFDTLIGLKNNHFTTLAI